MHCVVVLAGLGFMTIQFVFDPPTIQLSPDLYSFKPVDAFWGGDTDLSQYFDKKLWDVEPYTAKGSNEAELLLDTDLAYFK